jgi:sugar-specific transcriptional regulator TrmB
VAVYLELVEHGEGTPLSIARETGINRTKVYRLIEEMKKEKLIVGEIGENTTRVSPAPTEQLRQILHQKQTRVAELTSNWEQVERELSQMSMAKQAETKVKYYQGKSGLEQMVWNVLKAKGEIVGYTFRDLSDFVGEKFMGEFASEFKRRNLSMRDIYGDEYSENRHADNNWGEKMNSRYLPRKVLAIPHQMDIYDEVVTFYSWSAGEVWGSEIYNPKVAQMQKQLFELAWEKAKKI